MNDWLFEVLAMEDVERRIFKEQTSAIGDFIQLSTAPFIVKTEGHDDELFTGTFMNFCERYFIITAGHVFFDKIGKDIIVFGRRRPTDVEFRSIGKCLIAVPDNENVDVGIVELHDKDEIVSIKENWRFLSIENVTRSFHNSSTLIMGYPTEKALENKNKEFDPKPILIKTELLERAPPPEIKRIEGLDYFLEFGQTATNLAGEQVETPNVHGMSGAAVWQYRNSNSKIWAPSRSFKIVGIQVRMATSKSFLRIANWWAVAEALRKTDLKFESVLTAYLGSGST